MHFLKTDFDKWVDEDEQDGAVDDDPTGGMGDMGGMGGLGGDGGFGDLDFSKLSGAGGAGGVGGAGFGGEDADDLDEDDDEMPDLEDDGPAADKPGDEKIIIGEPEEKTVIGDVKPEGTPNAPAAASKKIEVVE